jgi:Fe-S cluster assembly scaffold protein SufB
VPDGARANAKISADVRSGTADYDVKIHESALLLGETGGVRGIPELRVASEDGLASHSATVERVSGEMLSYLASRGISRTLAQKTYLSARISQTYAGLAEPALEYLQKQIFKNLGF